MACRDKSANACRRARRRHYAAPHRHHARAVSSRAGADEAIVKPDSPAHEVARKLAGTTLAAIFQKGVSEMISLKVAATFVAAIAVTGVLLVMLAPQFATDLALVAVTLFG